MAGLLTDFGALWRMLLPLALLLQTGRDLGSVVTGEWLLGQAPIHALGMGYFAGMLAFHS